MVMVFNVTFNNFSVISWRSVLLVDETGVPGENHRPIASHWQTWSWDSRFIIYVFFSYMTEQNLCPNVIGRGSRFW